MEYWLRCRFPDAQESSCKSSRAGRVLCYRVRVYMANFGGSATVSWREGQELGQKLCVSTFRLVCRFQRPIKISTNSLGLSKAYATTGKGHVGILSHSQSDVGKHNWCVGQFSFIQIWSN